MRRSRRLGAAAALALCLSPAGGVEGGDLSPIRPPAAENALPHNLEPERPHPSGRLITQVEWAALLVEALGLAEALPEQHTADDLFSILCPDAAELTIAAGGRSVPARRPFQVVIDAPRAPETGQDLRIAVKLPATAIYALAVHGRGRQTWSVNRQPLAQLDLSPLGADVAAAVLPLPRGSHQLTARLAPDARIDHVELTAQRALCVAPAAGWDGESRLTFGAKARSMIRALGLEARLPVAGEAIVVEGERFDGASEGAARTAEQLLDVSASGDEWALAANGPVEFEYRVRLEDPGVYTLVARLHRRAGQLWSIDRRYRVLVRPSPEADGFGWTQVVTLPLGIGEHVLRARLPWGSGIDVMRLTRRRAADADYLAVLEAAGFREGAVDAPVTAEAAARNLAHPTFRMLAADFLERVSGGSGEDIVLIEADLDRLYSRPLSPLLPADL